MENTVRLPRTNFLRRLVPCLFIGIFCFSCGLDTILTIEAPTVTYNDPLYSSSDYLTWYHEFLTVEYANSSLDGGTFIGTDVYYKIYNNSSALNSQRAAILAVNSLSNSTASADVMIESYGYKPLAMRPFAGYAVFVPYTGVNRRIQFRLKTYTSSSVTNPALRAHIEFGDNYLGYNSSGSVSSYTRSGENWFNSGGGSVALGSDFNFVEPYRNGGAKSFDFFNDADDDATGTRNVEPASGDSDYYPSSQSEANTYYVQLFAVGVAFDTETVSSAYSLVLNLGSVPIIKGK